MRIALSSPNTFTVSVQTGSLWEYTLEASDDLQSWITLDAAAAFYPGDGARHSQRVVVPHGAAWAFFRYRIQERAGGLSGNALADWDRIYSFQANTALDTDGDGIPDWLEESLLTDKLDGLSFPLKVVRSDPAKNLAGHPRDQAVLLYLNQPLPASVTGISANYVRELHYVTDPLDLLGDYLDHANNAPGTVMILPGRKVVAFLPSPALVAGSNHTVLNNYRIDFSTATTGLGKLIPWHTEFSTVDFSDTVGPWVKLVRPGETAIEVAADFAPVIDWSQPLLPATVNAGNVSVVNQTTGVPVAVAVAFDYETNRMTLTHSTPFAPDTIYTVTLGTGFTNLMGKPLLNAFVWSFRTRPAPVLPVAGQGPYVAALSPGNYSTSVAPSTLGAITLTFSEAMNAGTLGAVTVHLRAHGAANEVAGAFAYDAATKTLAFTPYYSLDYATRYELTLDALSILSSATTPQPLQAQASFVFTTAPFNATGSSGTSGGMGGPGTGPGGGSGTPDLEQPPPLQLVVAYGDPDGDAGASVQLTVTLPDGSQRQMQLPNATNKYRAETTPEFPDGSTVEVAPQFLKGNDPDLEEELPEVRAAVFPLDYSSAAASSYAVFKQEGTTGAASASAADVWDFLGQLTAGPFIAQVKNAAGNKEKLKVGPAIIVPDANMVGVIGDVIPSALPESTIQHFVTPKKSIALNQNFVELKVNMAASEFAKLYVWEGGVAGSAANQRKVSRADTGTGPTEVKLKTKKEGMVMSQMDVWVVWATCTTTPGTAVFQVKADGSQYGMSDRWRFVFTIQPSLIVTGIASGDDVPDLRGNKKTKPPGWKESFPTDPTLGSGDTATAKWDVSRNLSLTIQNPGGILKGDLLAMDPIAAFWIGQRATVNDPIVNVTEPITFPAGDAEGNDDPILSSVVQDEHDDPYIVYSQDSLDHAIGQLSSIDVPKFRAFDSWISAVDQTFGIEADFLEFARLELVNGPLRAGQTWFRISDFVPWHHALRVKQSVSFIPPPAHFVWDNNGSDSATGNINH